nr:MAG TPA: hypothetical protein [Caudoviricetes sp.]
MRFFNRKYPNISQTLYYWAFARYFYFVVLFLIMDIDNKHTYPLYIISHAKSIFNGHCVQN